MDKDVDDFLEWITDSGEHASIWAIDGSLNNKDDFKIFQKIFTEEQAVFLRVLIKRIIWMVDKWHNEQDEECHKGIRQKIDKLQAQFRNHRHDFSKKFSGKAEY